jgi:transcriptional regulator with XRE-family HTH domain
MLFTIDGTKVLKLRKEQGKSRAYVGRVARRGEATIRAWETGRVSRTTDSTIEAMARALNVTPYDISPDYISPRDPLLGRVYFDQELAQRTRVLRRLSYRDLAERSALPLMTVHYIMTKDTPSAEAEQVYALALALEMRPGDLSQPLAAAPTLGQREFLKSAGMPLTYS